EDAVNYEIKRQEEVLEKGEKVRHETRGWDENKKITVSQRAKEESHDYRYFPEPDLPPLDFSSPDSGINLEKLKSEIPELPAQKRERFADEYGLIPKQAEILAGNHFLAQYFEEAASELKAQIPATNYQSLINYLTSDLLGLMKKEGVNIEELKIKPEHLAHLVSLIKTGDLSSRMAKDILLEMVKTGLDPHEIIKEKGISAVSDEDVIKKSIEDVIAENPTAVEDYKKGKENAKQFLIGKTMAKLKGQGNPEVINKVLDEMLTNQ
ncbi:Asp-tRNA(Asn)/Glu-tRNA(Gln) amidotransferase subunit GatB, partial [Candidatus Wolfebacteria bacterium]|nr:Asp-tRNA(Asn)/Glu-tRNA(Gln) amidotransferase subunit GatB [Candidatus Wolfebacteria bacterium]